MRALRKIPGIHCRRIGLFSLACLALLIFAGCDNSSSVDQERLLKWSQTSAVQFRKTGAMYLLQRNGEAWAVSTAELTVSETAFVYSGQKVLDTGFLVYPGRIEATNIQEAIRICSQTKGAVFKAQAIASNP